MEAGRGKCLNCDHEALIETLERNRGLCEPCVQEESLPELQPVYRYALLLLYWGIPFLIAGYVFYRCDKAEYGIFRGLIFFIVTYGFSSQGIGYLCNVLCWIFEKQSSDSQLELDSDDRA